jgi:hypothetical protein
LGHGRCRGGTTAGGRRGGPCHDPDGGDETHNTDRREDRWVTAGGEQAGCGEGRDGFCEGDGCGEDAGDRRVGGGSVPVGQQGGFHKAGRAESEPDHRERGADPAGADDGQAECGGGLDGEGDRDHHGQP